MHGFQLGRRGNRSCIFRGNFQVKLRNIGLLFRIAVSDKTEKNVKIFEAKPCLFPRNIAIIMNRQISQFTDKIQPPVEVDTDKFAKFIRIEQCHQIILIRHKQIAIDGIHPFYREFRSLAAVNDGRGKIDMKDLLGDDCNSRKALKFRIF